MNLSTRDKWMCAVLPALLTTIVMQRGCVRPINRDIEALQAQIQKQGPLSTRKAALKQAEAENVQLQALVNAKKIPSANNAVAPAAGGAFNRTLALEQISRLCEAGKLTLISSGPDTTAKLPPSIEQAAAVLCKPTDPLLPQVWKLEIRGPYVAMVEFLKSLGNAPVMVVPINLGMQPDANETAPISWTLSVWL